MTEHIFVNQPHRLLAMTGAVLLVAVGLAPLASAAGAGVGIGIFGTLLLGLGVLSAMRQALPSPGRTTNTRVPAGVVEGPLGLERGLVLVSGRRDLLIRCASIGLVAGCAAAGAVSAFVASSAGLGVVLLLATLATAATLIGPTAARWRATTLELTPTHLLTARYGSRCTIAWTEVSGAVPPTGPAAPGALVLHSTTNPSRTRGWFGWPKPGRTPVGVLKLMCEDLGVQPQALTRVIALCATDASLRAELGSPVSTDWSVWPPAQTHPGASTL